MLSLDSRSRFLLLVFECAPWLLDLDSWLLYRDEPRQHHPRFSPDTASCHALSRDLESIKVLSLLPSTLVQP